MNNPVEKIIDKFSQHSEFTFSRTEDGSAILSILKGDTLIIEVEISSDTPEWYPYIKKRSDNELLMWDSHIYLDHHYDEPFKKAAEELEQFLNLVALSEIRVRERNTLFTRHMKLQIFDNDEWRHLFQNPWFKWFNKNRGHQHIFS